MEKSSRKIILFFPMGQSCCGLPALMMGEKDAAREMAVQNVNAFKDIDLDYIVTLCASCASHLKNGLPALAGETTGNAAGSFADKVMSFSQFIQQKAGMKEQIPGSGAKKITWHSPCHLCRGLGIRQEPKDIMNKSGHEFVQAAEEETCCGFGESFSVNFPNVSKEIITKKLDDVENTSAELLVTECPGCVMQLRGGALIQNRNFKVIHLSELIAGGSNHARRSTSAWPLKP